MVSSLIFQKFSGEGLTEPPPQTPPPAFSRASPSVWASPSILGRFAPSTQVSPSIRLPGMVSQARSCILFQANHEAIEQLLDGKLGADSMEACLHTTNTKSQDADRTLGFPPNLNNTGTIKTPGKDGHQKSKPISIRPSKILPQHSRSRISSHSDQVAQQQLCSYHFYIPSVNYSCPTRLWSS